MQLGDKLKQMRLHCHMTQKELARDICSQAFLSKIENNLEMPNAQVLFHLCNKLGVWIEQLFMDSVDEIQKKIIYRKQVENLVREQKYQEALIKIQNNYLLNSYTHDYDYQFHYYYLGICNYHVNTNIDEAEKNFEFAYKQAHGNPYLKVTPISVLITNALAILKIHTKKLQCGKKLLEKCHFQLSNLSSNLHSEMHSKIFYNLSKCYFIEKEYKKALKIANEGIEWTRRLSTTYYLAQLYYQKGVAEIKLNQLHSAKKSLILALSASKIHNNEFLYNSIMQSDLYKHFTKELELIFQVLVD
ncbi:helix-turn-helix transcriptional regulator [Bacillus cereus]|uniref:helix-turn-helix domain-containing protein n=1 Tax=Bacillus cereus TaxID=1396 RepID=UPI00187A4ABC|nr:helix-turn-helix domain-containing protein [Bacillus cereus]MBE7106976.1 helix-turn-helix transcriptional regulator [Bacillus cereus]